MRVALEMGKMKHVIKEEHAEIIGIHHKWLLYWVELCWPGFFWVNEYNNGGLNL